LVYVVKILFFLLDGKVCSDRMYRKDTYHYIHYLIYIYVYSQHDKCIIILIFYIELVFCCVITDVLKLHLIHSIMRCTLVIHEILQVIYKYQLYFYNQLYSWCLYIWRTTSIYNNHVSVLDYQSILLFYVLYNWCIKIHLGIIIMLH
jgi:hypothetical protein